MVTVSKRIETREEMNQALAELFTPQNVNWTAIGTIKPHEERTKEGEKTGNEVGMYLTSQFRLPGVHAVTYDGDTFYTKNLSIKVDAFKLAESEFAVATSASAPKAATINAGTLKERIAAAKAYAAEKAKDKV